MMDSNCFQSLYKISSGNIGMLFLLCKNNPGLVVFLKNMPSIQILSEQTCVQMHCHQHSRAGLVVLMGAVTDLWRRQSETAPVLKSKTEKG